MLDSLLSNIDSVSALFKFVFVESYTFTFGFVNSLTIVVYSQLRSSVWRQFSAMEAQTKKHSGFISDLYF